MNVPKLRPVKNKEVKPPKIDQDIAFVLETLRQPLEAGFHKRTLDLLHRPPEFKSGPEYMAALHERVGRLGLKDVKVDLAASYEASMVPNPYGYLNYANKIWIPEHNVLVLTQVVTGGNVVAFPVREDPEPIAA